MAAIFAVVLVRIRSPYGGLNEIFVHDLVGTHGILRDAVTTIGYCS